MDAELAEERVLQAEIAAVRRACENPPAPWEEKSGVQYVTPQVPQAPLTGVPGPGG